MAGKHHEVYLRYKAKNPEKYRYNKYLQAAKSRGLAFDLSKDEFITLICSPCLYCGSSESIGVDRKDNSIGYIKENCVSCCWPCNKIKGKVTSEEFIEVCRKVSHHYKN